MKKNNEAKNLVISSNDLIHAKYNFTLWQKRIFMYFISKIEKDATEFQMQKADIADIINFFECDDSKAVYDIILEVPRQLYQASIQVFYTVDGYKRSAEVRIITKYTKPEDKIEKNAYIEFHFNDDLKPHLLELKRKFAQYDLINIIHLQSIHSIRLFEILKSHEYKQEVTLTIEYLKELLEITDRYSVYNDFKRYVIERAKKDLLLSCDIYFLYEEIKKRRRVTSLRFLIFKNEKNIKKVKLSDEQPISVAEPQPIIPKTLPVPKEETKKAKKPEKKQTTKPEITTENNNNETLYTEFEPDVVKGFGVTPFVLVNLIQNYDADLIRKQNRITKRNLGASPTKKIAGFFVENVKT